MSEHIQRPRRVLGVDGGGTKTHCILLDEADNLLGTGDSASSNRNSVGEQAARQHLALAIEGALQSANCTVAEIDAICVGMAGVDRPAERAMVAKWLSELLPGVHSEILNDALIALAAGNCGELYGVVMISGTGMIVYGVNHQGERRRSGGWGALLDAKGSGYALGMAALQAITRSADGLAPPTALTAAILEHLQLAQPQDLIAWTYADLAWARFAQLSPLVLACATDQDPVAVEIVNQHAVALAEAVVPVAKGLNLAADFPLVFAGGNLQAGLLREQVIAQVQARFPHAQLSTATDPAYGAAWYALRSIRRG